jgi:hypothetical protein
VQKVIKKVLTFILTLMIKNVKSLNNNSTKMADNKAYNYDFYCDSVTLLFYLILYFISYKISPKFLIKISFISLSNHLHEVEGFEVEVEMSRHFT